MCVFCEIITGKLSSLKVYEGDSFIAILDVFPIEKGHVLIITKKHYQNYLSVNNKILDKMNIVMKKIIYKGTNKMGAQGYNIISNINKCAGQEVFHFHWHLIPRYNNNVKNFKSKRISVTKKEMNEIKNKLLLT